MTPTFRQRLRYWFDNLMSRGTPALIGILFVASLLVVLIAGAVVSLSGFVQEGENGRLGFGEAVWQSLMRTLDSGTMGGDTGSGYRGVMLLVTLGGIFIVSALIGVLNNGLESQMDALRKGRSMVIENNHTLILGWSPQIFTILNELMAANENQRNACLVVLADKDKVEMEDEIRERVTMRGKTRIICRSGRPIDPGDLEIANPQGSKSIIILPPETDDPDTEVIKTVVAITKNASRRPEPYHIATQVRFAKNMSVLRMVCAQDKLQVVQTGDLIARIVAQTSRQSGLSVVYTELMDFGGDEIYFKSEPALAGKTFGDTLLAYEDSSVLGVRKADGRILLNPAMNTAIEAGDQLFAISEDDDTIKLSNSPTPVNAAAIRAGGKASGPKPAKCLILGWNKSGATIVRELDNYVAPGSSVTIVADLDDDGEAGIRAKAKTLKNQTLDVQQGDTTDRDLLDTLKVEDFDHVIVLAYGLPAQEADAKTLVTLLHLRDISERDQTPFSIVSEMLDLRNRELAKATQVDDFIVSEQLVSLMMAQFSENPDLYDVFTDIFDPEGSEIYLKPIGGYVATGQPVNFATVVEAARQRGETAIGYRLSSQSTDGGSSYGVYTNPPKSAEVTFSESDKVVVVAES